MPIWVQVLMWVTLVIASLAYLGFLLFRLVKKGSGVLAAAQPVLAEVKKLTDALEAKAPYEKPNDNLLDDVNVHLIERAKLLKRRARAAEQRQRRLIDKLKHPQESESKNA
jgi:hypothetical protein